MIENGCRDCFHFFTDGERRVCLKHKGYPRFTEDCADFETFGDYLIRKENFIMATDMTLDQAKEIVKLKDWESSGFSSFEEFKWMQEKARRLIKEEEDNGKD